MSPHGTTHPRGGQVGIGTLIVFIAMVLVAAVASGVLLQTSGVLQTRSSATGESSVDHVTNRLHVVGKQGTVSTASEKYTITVYNNDTLALVGDNDTDSQVYEKGVLTLHDRDVITLGSVKGPATFEYGSQSITYSDSQLTGTSAPYARASFEVIDDTGNVTVYDETHDTRVGTVDPPVTMAVSGKDYIRYRVKGDAGWEYEIGTSPSSSPPSGRSYVLNHTETRDRPGPTEVVGDVRIFLSHSPGAGNIDLRDATITYLSDGEIAHLDYTDGSPSGDTFTVEPIADSDPVLEDGEMAAVVFNTTSLGESDVSLTPGSSASVRITTASGSTSQTVLDVPDSVSSSTVAL